MNAIQLEALVKQASEAYYAGQPIMSDAKFDQYMVWLKAVKPDSVVIKKTGSGYNPANVKGNKFEHIHGGMESINDKPRTLEEVPNNLRENVKVSAKLDGLSGVVHIKNGEIIRCLTRGDGKVGIDKTDKFKALAERVGGITATKDITCEVRGEFVISNENWDKMIEEGTTKKNARNAASGIINADDITNDFKYLEFVPYKIVYLEDSENIDSADYLEYIQGWFKNFPKVPHININSYDESQLLEEYLKWKNIWPCDGVVITSRDVDVIDDCFNYTEAAYKFDTLKKATKVKSITWQMSRLNIFKPVAELEPIELGGSTVRRATLHNAATVKLKNIKENTEIMVLKAGDIIPYIEDVIDTDESTSAPLITICPKCGSILEWQGVDLKCTNPDCSNIELSSLMHWTKHIGLVDGMSDTLISKYYERFGIENLSDVYKISLDFLEKSMINEGVQSAKFYEVVRKLQQDKVPLSKALIALNIPRLGEVSSDKLSKDKDFILFVKAFSDNEFSESWLNDNTHVLQPIISRVIGEATATAICSATDLFVNLKYLKGRMKAKAEEKVEAKGFVCITGKLTSGSRKDFEARIAKHGWLPKEEITKKVSYLITNTPNTSTSKNKKADDLGVTKITEADFLKMIEG